MKILKDDISYKPNAKIGLTGIFNNELEIEMLSEMIGKKLLEKIDINDMSLYDWQKISWLRYPNIDDEKINKTKDKFSEIDNKIKRDYSLKLLDNFIYYSYHSIPDTTSKKDYGFFHKRYGKPIQVFNNKNKELDVPNLLHILTNGNYAIDDGRETHFLASGGSNKKLIKILEKEYKTIEDRVV